MAFENISKGEFKRTTEGDNGVIPSKYPTIGVDNGYLLIASIWADVDELSVAADQNAEFIAYCFNLQQRYDISKLEEAVDLLSKIAVKLLYGFEIKQDSDIHKQIEQLLEYIKK